MKKLIKKITDLLMRWNTFPIFLLFRAGTLLWGERRAMGLMSETLSLIPGVFGEWFRRGVLQWITGLPLKDCCISFGVTFSDSRIRIGNGVYIGRRSDIGYADIGENCVIGSAVHILSGLNQHGIMEVNTSICDQPGEYTKVIVGEGCWIGNGAIVGANIGGNTVVGCGSVVIRSLPGDIIAAGNPAKKIHNRI